jgi:hypothetical protein
MCGMCQNAVRQPTVRVDDAPEMPDLACASSARVRPVSDLPTAPSVRHCCLGCSFSSGNCTNSRCSSELVGHPRLRAASALRKPSSRCQAGPPEADDEYSPSRRSRAPVSPLVRVVHNGPAWSEERHTM